MEEAAEMKDEVNFYSNFKWEGTFLGENEPKQTNLH